MAGFQPSAEDLDYPAKLERAEGQHDNGHPSTSQPDSTVRFRCCCCKVVGRVM